MTKLPGRIPSQSVSQSSGWSLPEIGNLEGSKTIRLKSSGHNGRNGKLNRPTHLATNAEAQGLVGDVANPSQKVDQGDTKRQSNRQQRVQSSGSASAQDLDDILEQAIDSQTMGDSNSGSEQSPMDTESVATPPAALTQEQGYTDGLERGEVQGFAKGEKEGYEVGLKAGTISGRESAAIDVKAAFDQEVAAQREVLAGLVRGFSEPPQFEAGLEASLVDLITELTKVVVAGEVRSHPEHIAHLVTRALKELPHNSKSPRVFVNPSDLDWLAQTVQPDVELVADPSLSRGGCRIESSQSQVQAPLSQRIRQALIAACEPDVVPEISEPDIQQIDAGLSD